MKAEVLTPFPSNEAVPKHLSQVCVGGASGTCKVDTWRARAQTPPACHLSLGQATPWARNISCQPN